MSALRKNVASQVLTFVLVKAADGTALTGATCGGDWVKDGTQAGFAGTFTELSNGQYQYVPTQAETNVTAWGLLITATGAIPVNLTGFTTAADPTDPVRMGLTALPNAAAGASGGLPTGDASGRVTVASIANGAIAAATFAANALDAVWSTATRILTAGTNIVLAKGTGLTGLNDIAAGAAMTLTGAYDAAKTAAQAGDDMNVSAINGDTLAAEALQSSTDTICFGTCSGGTPTTAVVGTLNNPASLTDAGQLIGRTIIFLGSAGTANVQAQASNITASTTGATPTITFTAMTHAPANSDKFVVV